MEFMSPSDLCLSPLEQVDPLRFTVSSGACDCHAHIFGPKKMFPFIADRSYTPPEASIEAYKNMHRKLGITRAVIVQPSVYGTDNQVTLTAIKQYGNENARGIAVVDNDVSELELERLHEKGIRGVRFNLLFKGGAQFKYLERISSKIAPFNWHVQILMDVSELQLITDRLRRLPTEIVFDHMGHISTNHGTNNLGFQALINLIKEGRAWVKLSGNYRISSAKPPYKDAEAFARALISASQKRVVWGSDWPHPGLHDTMPNDGALLNALDEYAASDQLKHAILVNNPAELYGFNTSPKGSEYDK